ncbi:site-specific DNA-methyltransferase [Mycolicibacterium neoaurum]|uniref:Adenine specific DNA methylase Mod n=1 Tax=Mycolicibacterium neoaurum TaxID=1795 RepID=A0AAV2WN64_MYCNE|nr:site-specific DNA-methyltransferase [Mycolicibacterium neoaurum]TLH57901.1 site-specific DNA-methyltransferase [Mycolicibacterium neoaurum]CDQ45686.1 adenine specific DNA methylase Mod [Mycolicibacterium neoaurum]
MVDDVNGLEALPVEQLVEMIREKTGAGVNLSFPGKVVARQLGRRVRPRNQRTIKSLSTGDEYGRSRNLVIEGDNLQALASLYRERGQIDMIMTDPPYNTGNDFRYNDKWDKDPNDPDLGEFVGSDDPAKHTKWMKFMYPRLQMMRAMLKPSGVLAICIDGRELFHLGQMLDELFGEENRLAIINWQKSYSPKSDNRHVSTATEYVLVYARNEKMAKTGLETRTESMNARYINRDGDTQLWKSENATGPKARTHQGMVYGIQSPFTGEMQYPPAGRCWVYPQRVTKRILEEWGADYTLRTLDDAKLRAEIAGVDESDVRAVKALVLKTPMKAAKAAALRKLDNGPWPEIYFGIEGNGRPQLKRYLEDVKKGRVPLTYWADEDIEDPEVLGDVSWDHEDSGHSQTGVTELSNIVGSGHGFETVKPMKLITKLIQIWCPTNGTVLDPFAGSGTTGHAVLELNEVQGADRRFILVEQGRPDNGDSYAKTLTVERLRRVIDGDWSKRATAPLGGGFTFKTLEKKVDAKTLLLMERDEMIDTVIASHSSTGMRRNATLIALGGDAEPYTYLVAKNAANEGIYLVWSGAGSNTDLTEDAYEKITQEAEAAGLAEVYHVYSRRNLIVTDDVIWYQIPDRILSDFGLDVRTESFTEEV